MAEDRPKDEVERRHKREGLTEDDVEGHRLHKKEGLIEDDVEGHRFHRK